MQVYSKSYLDGIVKTQGELFDFFARRYPDCDTADFITEYMNGKTRADIDAGQAYVCTMNSDELMQWYLGKSAYQTKPGESMKGFLPDWIGRFYAYYQWATQVSSRDTIKAVPISFMKLAYPGLHDLDLRLAVKKVSGN